MNFFFNGSGVYANPKKGTRIVNNIAEIFGYMVS